MTETVVNFVLGKLGEMIVKEAQFLGKVGSKVKWVETELTRIKCYLTDADNKRRQGEKRAENYLNELRDVAYRIEDAIDTFYVEIEDNRHKLKGNNQKDHGCLGKLKKLGRKTTKLPALHNLGTQLDEIRDVLEGIFESTTHYQINPLQERGKGETVPMPSRRATYQTVEDETEIVGFGTHKKEVLKLILDPETRRRVVTIVGCGGLGKTTLAQMVYKKVQADFKYHTMLSVSQQFDPTNLLRTMLSNLKGYQTSTQEIGDLISELNVLLSRQRYLILLDDVWVTDLWNQIKYALPDVKNGSRVLITSRFIEIAQSADPVMAPYKLKFLNDEDSRDLLIKKAFLYREPDETSPSDLLELANALSKKCKGLPLALIVLGGILSTKDRTYIAWEKELRTLDWHYNGKDCIDILSMSYEDMPCYLKTCFLYLASFPEDYEITAKYLIRMWVAEGLVPQQGKKMMEEIAEDCLEQLFQRSMIQVLSRYENGSIKYCGVHDLLRNLALHKAGKENFVTVFTNPQDINVHRDRAIRRASLQSCSPQFIEYIGQKTRSMFLFDPENKLPDYSKFSLLRVLEIVYLRRGEVNLRGVDRLIHLKYLGVRDCDEVDMSECSFGCLKNLETLDLQRNNRMSILPTNLWTISTLRHVLCDCCFHDLHGLLNLPEVPSTADLRNLQTLEWIPFNNKEIPHLNNLRRLGLKNESTEWDVDHAVPHLFGGLLSLTSLKIIGSNLPVEIIYPSKIPNYQNLQNLLLGGSWSNAVTLKASLFPQHLVELELQGSNLRQDSMLELGKLNYLNKLHLICVVYEGKQMICPAGFPVLRTLVLHTGDIEVLTVAKGVMPNLKEIFQPVSRVKLEMPPELTHLTLKKSVHPFYIRRKFYRNF